jgi:hypothetical protein
VVCKNPLLAAERARKSAQLLADKDLAIAARVQRAGSPLHGAATIGQAVAACWDATWPGLNRQRPFEPWWLELVFMVESRCGAVAVGHRRVLR